MTQPKSKRAQVTPLALQGYFELMRERPDWFVNTDGGVRIETDPDKISAIEATVAARYRSQNLPAEWATAGLHYEDPYLVLLRDAVYFPDGSPGIHHRILRRSVAAAGSAILPVLNDRIVLMRQYRHATRSWQWEAPRGAVDPGETPLQSAHRELQEEISARVRNVVHLGEMHGTTALMGLPVILFFAVLDDIGATPIAEGISGTRLVTPGEFEALVRDGEITDSFTLGCFLHARLRGLL